MQNKKPSDYKANAAAAATAPDDTDPLILCVKQWLNTVDKGNVQIKENGDSFNQLQIAVGNILATKSQKKIRDAIKNACIKLGVDGTEDKENYKYSTCVSM
jgi:hypothetical protein